MSVQCFWIDPTDRCRRSLRRYESGSTCADPRGHGYHDAQTPIEDGYTRKEPEVERLRRIGASEERIASAKPDDWTWDCGPKDVDRADPRWPAHCACGYAFEPDDEWQVFTDVIYRRADNGEEFVLRDAPDGAMWNAAWLGGSYCRSQDSAGRIISVRCPGGSDWIIDSRASNCTMPNDRDHHCWIRHGEPPRISVDKSGLTCAAGAGSIIAGKYHGFLRHGVFTSPL